MNETVREILSLLEAGRPELQVAAAQILGELRPRDPNAIKSLAAAVSRSHVLGRYALESLARYGTLDALRVVVRAVVDNEMLADQAIHLLAEAGPAATSVVAEAFAEAPTEKRIRLLQVLARNPGRDLIGPLVHALATPEISDAAQLIALGAQEQMSTSLLRDFRDAIGKTLEQPLPDHVVGILLALAAKFDRSGAKGLLMKFATDKSPVPVRAAALRALAGQPLTEAQIKGFLAELEDPDRRDVHPAVRELLASLSVWPAGLAGQLKRLLAARSPEQRLLALRALRNSPSPNIVKMALKLRDHDDARFRSAAEEVLASNRLAVDALIRLVQVGKDPVEGRRLAGLLQQHGDCLPPRQVRAIVERAIKLMTTNTVASDLLCDVAIAVAGRKIVPFLTEKAVRWRKLRRFPEALHVLAKLAAGNLLDGEGSYQLALTRFLQDVTRPRPGESTPGNAAMGFFTVLLRDGFPLLDRIKKETSLGPEHLLRLASYFAETVGLERRFGADLLQHLATRHKGRTGEEARSVLRAVGL